MFTISNHLLDQANFLASPNFSVRPEGVEPSLLVIHNISLPPGEFGGGFVEDFFQNKLDSSVHPYFKEIEGLEVSSHLLLDRKGNLTQFVDFSKKAWHAGVSEYEGQNECNDFSIGIELEGTDTEPYSNQQYLSLVQITICIMENYSSITKNRIVGHSDIAPGRKTDPGESFDWERFRSLI